jgi:hypothetical protein
MISVQSLFDSTYIGGGSSVQSSAIDLRNLSEEADLFFDILLSGLGAVNAKYMLGVSEGDTFITPSGATNICSAHDGTSGVAGRNYFAIASPILAPYMKIELEETGVGNVTVSANLIIKGNVS